MTVTSISGASSPFPPQGAPPRTPPAMTASASLLGMSADDLRAAQRSGTTLADLAAQKGVSKDDLVKSVAADLAANKPEGAPELSRAQLTEMATNIAEGRRPQGPPPPPPPPPGGGFGSSAGDGDERVQTNVGSLAEALGTDADTLLDKLRSGADLASLLRGATAAAAAGYGASATSAATVTGGLAVDRYA
jgi:hypothetical protein